jgi:hypothetical protein
LNNPDHESEAFLNRLTCQKNQTAQVDLRVVAAEECGRFLGYNLLALVLHAIVYELGHFNLKIYRL